MSTKNVKIDLSKPKVITRKALDKFQEAFCQSEAENIRLLAPAGSGKTQSLLWRCSEIHQRQGGKVKFLVVTFTKAARDELKQRVSSQQFSDMAADIEVVTLNSWGWKRVKSQYYSPRLLTSEAEKIWCIRNTLQPFWKESTLLSAALKSNKYNTSKKLMEAFRNKRRVLCQI